ncbi:GxxExxY protein [Candidatus Falkowbacteria bacterium CG10_big_fil_rev_8_21_14_0_10_43_11]|uniref:GxxExxY protein n=1 Tax=Candidatus Falkowbacteria bacterium CG10_big_fil_rev_8_21_14_0_10_43_11 TaxID=1974568 RepID=A0A2M6WLB5_9BACT|nr:MAG: GxxExxY protein [Candidatus Falkowbacteria bacterium CG10_big_fil_rev_8_21_14_0_10_43_11]
MIKYERETGLCIKAFYNVYNILGYGFLEKVYEHSMLIELKKFSLYCLAQVPIKVHYDGHLVGDYFADIIVNNLVIIELKAMESLCPEHEAQLLNYLKATDIEVGLLFNFGKTPQFKRKMFDNELKNNRTRMERI